MTREEFRNYLLDTLPGARAAKGGAQIICICPCCGDTSGHCYIGPFDDDTKPVMYNCFKCPPSNPARAGIVNQNFMNRYNCWMPEGFGSTPASKDGFKAKRITGRTVLDLQTGFISNTQMSYDKLNYINKRLGAQLTFDDVARLKLVLNLSDILNGNQIKKYSRHINDMNTLDTYFVGAVGVNNNIISLRNLVHGKDPNVDKRSLLSKKYVNYVVNEDMDYHKYYVVPTQLNTFRPVNIHVCEGFMDALGIHLNLHNGISDNDVIIAGFGKSYSEAVEYVMSSFPFTYARVHLYPDSDVSDYSMKKVSTDIAPFVNEIYVHRNQSPGQKDYGVPKSMIMDKSTRIL